MTEIQATFRPIQATDLKAMWEIAFGPKADLTWMQFNGPYFSDPVMTWSEFSKSFQSRINDVDAAVICVDEQPVGMLSSYFEDGQLGYWLEAGIVIYDVNLWHQGIGKQVFPKWIVHLFESHPELAHVGFTTWSGNISMMKLGERSGLTLEGRIRSVRFWQNQFYDSIKYGILRTELAKLNI